MELEAATTVEQLEEVIRECRVRILNTKKLHDYYHSYLWPWRPEAWEAVDEAIKTQARYWRGEIIRAKHNLARYMRGEELQLQRKYFVHTTQNTWLRDDLATLDFAIDLEEDPDRPEIMGKSDREYYLICCDSIKNDTEYVRRFIYAG